MGKYFGTDGVRGVAGADLTCELAMKIGRGAAAVLTGSTGHRPRILIGKDTRQSGDMLEAALTAGLCSVGADVESLGVLPTPAVAYLVGKYNADAGIVISASHNPMEFNGIKIFAGTGYKLPDEVENEIEAYIDNKCAGLKLATGDDVGRVTYRTDGIKDYADHLYESINGDLSGLNVCIDCANGASAAVARQLFPRLGAKCTFIGIAPDGQNINRGVGSTHLENLEKAVVEGVYPVSEGRHCRLRLRQGNACIYAVWFGMHPEQLPYATGDVVDAALSLSVYEAARGAQLSGRILELHPAGFGNAAAQQTALVQALRRGSPLTAQQRALIAPERSDIITVYRELQARRWHAEDMQPLFAKLGEEHSGKTLVALTALEQVGLIAAVERGGAKFWELVPTAGKKNLADAPILKCLEE